MFLVWLSILHDWILPYIYIDHFINVSLINHQANYSMIAKNHT